MTTFYGTYGSAPLLASVAANIDKDIPADVDVHTITLVLNGSHGEFDLVVEGTADVSGNLEGVRFEGVAHRSGGVAGFHRVDAN